MGRQAWHPVVTDVLATLVREDGGPTIDEQLLLASRIGELKEKEQDRVLRELTAIGLKLRKAGEREAEGCVRGIAALAASMGSTDAIARRVYRD